MSEFYPKYMYSKEFPAGKIFEDARSLQAAGSGWFESPADIKEEIPDATIATILEKDKSKKAK
jgi:hypothetical protein